MQLVFSRLFHSQIQSKFLAASALLATAQILVTPVMLAKPADKKSTAASPALSKDNPFLQESTLPYHLPPFDKIKDGDFLPAIEKGMQEQLKEADAIAATSEKPTFENTIVALEKTGQLLERAERTFSNLNACNTNPTMQKIESELAPKLAAHRDAIHLNGKLFARVEELFNNRDKLGLDPESNYLLERYYKDFVRAGAKLSDPRQAEAQSDKRGTGQLADDIRAECSEGEKRLLCHRG